MMTIQGWLCAVAVLIEKGEEEGDRGVDEILYIIAVIEVLRSSLRKKYCICVYQHERMEEEKVMFMEEREVVRDSSSSSSCFSFFGSLLYASSFFFSL